MLTTQQKEDLIAAFEAANLAALEVEETPVQFTITNNT